MKNFASSNAFSHGPRRERVLINPHFSRPVRNAHTCRHPSGVSRELRYSSRAGAFAPASCFPRSLRRVTLSQTCKVCEKVRLTPLRFNAEDVQGNILRRRSPPGTPILDYPFLSDYIERIGAMFPRPRTSIRIFCGARSSRREFVSC